MDNTLTKISLPDIRNLIEKIENACSQFQMVSLTRQLEAAQTLLSENPPIDVAVLGQFKAGKSSFLNSLLNQTVLPVGVIPVTTAVTRLQYGNKEKALIRHFDGHTTETSLNDIVKLLILNCLHCKNIQDCALLTLRDWGASINITNPHQKNGFLLLEQRFWP
jgi:hypothetical protein